MVTKPNCYLNHGNNIYPPAVLMQNERLYQEFYIYILYILYFI